jgi:hypothetical protein
MATTLSIIQTGTGIMPLTGATALAQAQAAARTTALASQNTAMSSQILASTGGSVPLHSSIPIPGSLNDPSIATLWSAANQACYVSRNPASCSELNQRLAAAQAASTCPGGSAIRGSDTLKQQGSIQAWLYQPAFVSPAKPVSADVAAVGVTLAATASRPM